MIVVLGSTWAYEQRDKLVTLQWSGLWDVISLQTLCWEIGDERRPRNNDWFWVTRQNAQRHEASRGLSAIAELLVFICGPESHVLVSVLISSLGHTPITTTMLLPPPRRSSGRCYLCVCLSVSGITEKVMSQFHWNCYDWIYQEKNCLTFSGAAAPVPDTDSVSLFHFPSLALRNREF